MMKDKYNRIINYLRLSITQRCNLKCIYCNPFNCPEATDNHLLSVNEIERICRILFDMGINRIRLTGGEPLLRKDLESIISAIRNISKDIDLSLSTNGQGLSERAESLKKSGLNRVNISLDSLRKDKYSDLTGGGRLEQVLISIDKCLLSGLNPVKLNVVLMKGINDDEIMEMIELTKNKNIEVRFIELMPLSDLGRNPEHQMTAQSVLELEPRLCKLPEQNPCQPAVQYGIKGYQGKVGLIQPVSHKFCNSCNRIRITADGMFKPCLGDDKEISLLPALSEDDNILQRTLENALLQKPKGHNFNNSFNPERSMNHTGG